MLNLIPNLIAIFVIVFWYHESWQNRLKKKIAPNTNLRSFCWILTIIQYSLVFVGGYLMKNYIKSIALNIALEYGVVFNATGKYSLDLYPIIDWKKFGIKGLAAKLGAILLGISSLVVFLLI